MSCRRFELGYPRTELRRQLVAAVLRGDTATAGLRSDYAPHTDEPLPRSASGSRCSTSTTGPNQAEAPTRTSSKHARQHEPIPDIWERAAADVGCARCGHRDARRH